MKIFKKIISIIKVTEQQRHDMLKELTSKNSSDEEFEYLMNKNRYKKLVASKTTPTQDKLVVDKVKNIILSLKPIHKFEILTSPKISKDANFFKTILPQLLEKLNDKQLEAILNDKEYLNYLKYPRNKDILLKIIEEKNIDDKLKADIYIDIYKNTGQKERNQNSFSELTYFVTKVIKKSSVKSYFLKSVIKEFLSKNETYIVTGKKSVETTDVGHEGMFSRTYYREIEVGHHEEVIKNYNDLFLGKFDEFDFSSKEKLDILLEHIEAECLFRRGRFPTTKTAFKFVEELPKSYQVKFYQTLINTLKKDHLKYHNGVGVVSFAEKKLYTIKYGNI